MRIAIGSDHGGCRVKKYLIGYLTSSKIRFIDLGVMADETGDYPDLAFKVAENVKDKYSDLGILVCTTGLGMVIAANKVRGIRAALLRNTLFAKLAKAHNNANVICFSGTTSRKTAIGMLDVFISTKFEGGRHRRRIQKITDYENNDTCRQA